MNLYVTEIYMLSKDLEKTEEEQKLIYDEFNKSNLPKALFDARKKRQDSATSTKWKLKRPPQTLEPKKTAKDEDN